MLKKFTRLAIMSILMLVTIFLCSCGSGIEEPTIKISYESGVLKPIYYGDRHNKDKNEIEERLRDFMIGKRFTDLPTIDFEDKILIEALNFETDEFEIYDYIIDKKCNIISNYNVEPFKIGLAENKSAEFMFETSKDIEKYSEFTIEGNLVHCLLIRCQVNNSSFAFSTLILKTNE